MSTGILRLSNLALFTMLTLISALASSSANAQNQVPNVRVSEERFEDFFQAYEKRLQSLVKARFQEEQDFIRQVVGLVREGTLPKSVVDRAWVWVSTKRSYSGYPFVYFERVLRLQAEKLNIEIPQFDRSIYSQARRQPTTSRRRR